MGSTITSKGQVTLPKPVREHLGLKPGDKVKFFIHPDGTAVLLPELPASALRGFLASRRRPVSTEEMDEAVADAAAAKLLRDQK